MFIGIYGRKERDVVGLSDLGKSQLGNVVFGDVVEFNVIVSQFGPDQIGKNQAMDHTPDQIDTVEEVGVTGAQDNPTVVENGGQKQGHQENKGREEMVLAMGNNRVFEDWNERQGKGEVSDGRVGFGE